MTLRLIPGEMTEKEHDDDTNEDAGQIDLVMRAAVPVWPDVGIPEHLTINRNNPTGPFPVAKICWS